MGGAPPVGPSEDADIIHLHIVNVSGEREALIPLDLAMALVGEAFASPTISYRLIGKADVTGTRTLQIEKDDYAVDERGSITREQMEAVIPNTLRGPH